ncbi:hypothetical protein CEUSTIGMA_g8576.t1 [Chlamydomonas eustigma]|uniref:RING-CH-type domain-containing protein n=1 Tax=Chlamydomonas eustigma TaxID=1157962 RepID=A0A250XDI2_9CHLO|nr:hypothetical protein CEUSTIGMA_g8576.t1 [Chlamydomonas eustigma]|eukprot:GAX81143.1 hypothetical protein CEUSTIGMA_g8576.t1 [Chlamydomonas eustigma]
MSQSLVKQKSPDCSSKMHFPSVNTDNASRDESLVQKVQGGTANRVSLQWRGSPPHPFLSPGNHAPRGSLLPPQSSGDGPPSPPMYITTITSTWTDSNTSPAPAHGTTPAPQSNQSSASLPGQGRLAAMLAAESASQVGKAQLFSSTQVMGDAWEQRMVNNQPHGLLHSYHAGTSVMQQKPSPSVRTSVLASHDHYSTIGTASPILRSVNSMSRFPLSTSPEIEPVLEERRHTSSLTPGGAQVNQGSFSRTQSTRDGRGLNGDWSARGGGGKSTHPVSIPAREGRTYRVVTSASPRGGADEVMVVAVDDLEGRTSPQLVQPSGSFMAFVGGLLGSKAGTESGVHTNLLPHHFRGYGAPATTGDGGSSSGSVKTTDVLSNSLAGGAGGYLSGYMGGWSRAGGGTLDGDPPSEGLRCTADILGKPVGTLLAKKHRAFHYGDIEAGGLEEDKCVRNSGSGQHLGGGKDSETAAARSWARRRSYAALGAPPRGAWGAELEGTLPASLSNIGTHQQGGPGGTPIHYKSESVHGGAEGKKRGGAMPPLPRSRTVHVLQEAAQKLQSGPSLGVLHLADQMKAADAHESVSTAPLPDGRVHNGSSNGSARSSSGYLLWQQQQQQQGDSSVRGGSGGSCHRRDSSVGSGSMIGGIGGAYVEPYDPRDVATIIGSLPMSFGAPTLGAMKRSNSMVAFRGVTAVAQGATTSSHHSPQPGFYTPYGNRSLSRAQSNNSISSMGKTTPPPVAAALPICLICLEMLTPDDFQCGEAIALECGCSGDVALRHRACAIEWNNAKGNTLCDICKHDILNLPPVDPELLARREEARRRREPNFSVSSDYGAVDYIFDAIRVTWVVAVILILIANLDMGIAFLVGLAAGILYVMASKLVRMCASVRRYRLLQAQWEAERRQQEGERSQGRQQRLYHQGLREPLINSD